MKVIGNKFVIDKSYGYDEPHEIWDSFEVALSYYTKKVEDTTKVEPNPHKEKLRKLNLKWAKEQLKVLTDYRDSKG